MVVTRIDKKIVSHLYRRAGFGITEDEIDDFKDKNLILDPSVVLYD